MALTNHEGRLENMYHYSKATTLSPELARQLSLFLSACPGFHYFQSPAFFSVCQSSPKLDPAYIIANAGTEIVGVLLYFKQVQFTFPIASFLSSRTIIWGGPVARDGSLPIVEGLLMHYRCIDPFTIYTQVRNLFDTGPYKDSFIKQGFHYEEHLNILVDLTLPEEDLWKGIQSRRRSQIRKSEREGCLVEQQHSVTALNDSYSILEEVYQRARLPLPEREHFEALLKHADEASGLRVFTVSWEGKTIGCMLCLAHGTTLFEYYTGSYSAYYKKLPNDLLPWAVFMLAKKEGFTRFDFGGAGKPGVPYGVRDQKEKFGGKLVCYGRYTQTTYPYLLRTVTTVFELLQTLKKPKKQPGN